MFKMSSFSCACFLTLFSLAFGLSTDPNDVSFYYYTSENERVEIEFNDTESLENSNLLPNTHTVLVIDGFLSNDTTPMSQMIKNAFVNQNIVQNVILVDYGPLSGSGSTLPLIINLGLLPVTYVGAVTNVDTVGLRVADFLAFLNLKKGIAFSDVHIAGHSLGAQVAGQAGTYVRTKYGGSLGRISGLDPAGPLFTLDVPILNLNKLDSTDATFVDIYHTSAGTMGDLGNDGDLNVFVNGGQASQPGCASADLPPAAVLPGLCSHYYSYEFYNESFSQSLNSCPCSYILNPFLTPLLSTCCVKGGRNTSCGPGSKVVVGVYASSSTSGNYNFDYPYTLSA